MAKHELIRNVGGGWYALPDGRKVRKAELTRLLAENTLPPPSLAGRFRFARQAGLQYGGRRDIYTVAGYTPQGKEDFEGYWSLYDRDPIAGRIVDMPAKTTWKTPAEVLDGPGDDDREQATMFEEAWVDLAKRLRIWRHFERADRLARVGRYSVMLLGTKGVDDRAMATEMQRLRGGEDVVFLSSFAEKYARIAEWEKDPNSARFGMPRLYKINISGGTEGFPEKDLLVHWSRVLHVAEDPLLDEVYGRPALKRCLNILFDALKVSAATGEAYWQLAAKILKASVDPEAEMEPGQLGKMGEALEEIVHDLRRHFTGQGVDLDWLQSTTPDPSSAMEMMQSLMAVGSGIPKRVLFGSERGELASSQDERNYFGMINERQEQHAEPHLLRAFIDRMVLYGGLPAPITTGGEYTVVWPALFELTEKEVAEGNKLRADAAKALTGVGGDPFELVEIDAERNVWLRPSAEVKAIREEREQKEAAEEEQRRQEEEQRIREENARRKQAGEPLLNPDGTEPGLPSKQPPPPPGGAA